MTYNHWWVYDKNLGSVQLLTVVTLQADQVVDYDVGPMWVKLWLYVKHADVHKADRGSAEKKGLANNVCMDMLAALLGINLRVYIDNIFMLVVLLSDLYVHGILACGTMRANQKE